MIVHGQKVKIRWNSRNKEHFISMGYTYTKFHDEFEIEASHLTKGSTIIVKVKCDYCFKDKDIIFNQYYDQVIKHNLNKYCCKECGHIRLSENHKNKRKGFKHAKDCKSSKNKGIIYEIVDEYISELNEDQLILINEIKRFCEENDRFPTEKDMSNKNGYVSRTQFYKTFNTKNFTDIYQYIFPLQMGTRKKDITKIQKQTNKPKIIECIHCKFKKEFTSENFPEDKASKFGLRHICKECQNTYSFKLRYKNKGIIFKKWEDIEPEQWWEYLYEGKIGYLPDFCLEENNAIQIVRYIFLKKLKFNKYEICAFHTKQLKEFKIYHLYRIFKTKLNFLNKCFPEMNIDVYDLPRSLYPSEEDKINFVKEWIFKNDYSINDILDGQYNKNERNMDSFVTYNFNGYLEMWMWYFNASKINHPITNEEITELNFKCQPGHFRAKDGSICNSREELKIYEFVKYELGLDIKAIGTLFKGDHVFKLPEDHEDNKYCPDFVINNKNTIYIEYFGLYRENTNGHKVLEDYKNKTLRKINFYNTLPDKFIYLFPEDVRYSLDGLVKKFTDMKLINNLKVV